MNKIMILGEAWGRDEAIVGQPFVGAAGETLNKILAAVGLSRDSVHVTNLFNFQPPDNDFEWLVSEKQTPDHTIPILGRWVRTGFAEHLDKLDREITTLRPNIIIALGNQPLWYLTGKLAREKDTISKWRGSVLPSLRGPKLLPTYHPAFINRDPSVLCETITDFNRAKYESEFPELRLPPWSFILNPSYEQVIATIQQLLALAEKAPLRLAVDIETRNSYFSCIGIAWNNLEAICIPVMHVDGRGHYSTEEEAEIALWLRDLLTHKNTCIIGQYFFYDVQYFARYYGFVPRVTDDTYIMQHVAFVQQPHSLDFLASLHCNFYQYWKDEGKEWDPKIHTMEQHWRYNCLDCVYTFEVASSLRDTIHSMELDKQYQLLMESWYSAVAMMFRGFDIDKIARDKALKLLFEEREIRQHFLREVIGYDLNVRSAPQMHKFLYEELALPPIRARKATKNKGEDRPTKKVTANFDALVELGFHNPWLLPLCDAVLEIRSMGTFIKMLSRGLDIDGKFRALFNPGGTDTYRHSSTENAFGSGGAVQNIPDGSRKRAEGDKAGLVMQLPNLRKVFIPPPGHTLADIDQRSADLCIVAWESDDTILKQMLLDPSVDVHTENAKLLFNKSHVSDHERYMGKQFVHATDYDSSAITISMIHGIPVELVQRLQLRWFAEHPGIKERIARIREEIITHQEISNIFGFRIHFYGRITDHVIKSALAWSPQSTVAVITNLMINNIARELPEVSVINHVHDSVLCYLPTHRMSALLPHLHRACSITVPFPDPFIMPIGLKTSPISWGDCKKQSWGHNAALPTLDQSVHRSNEAS